MAFLNLEDFWLQPVAEEEGYMVTRDDLTYMDSQGETYVIPKEFKTDGASIPKAFWSMVGGPFSGKYLHGAVIHDYLCKMGYNKKTPLVPYKRAHEIFYEAMIEDGVPEKSAKLMYWAVKNFGPKWDFPES